MLPGVLGVTEGSARVAVFVHGNDKAIGVGRWVAESARAHSHHSRKQGQEQG